MCRPKAAWSTLPARSARWHASSASPTCWTPASRSARCRSTSPRSAATWPRGTGFLYCKRSLLQRLEPPFLDLHAATWTASDSYRIREDARRFENWETYYAGKIGLGVAVDAALQLGLDAIEGRVSQLADALRQRLRALPGVVVHDQGRRQCGIVTFTVDGHDPQGIAEQLRTQAINVSVSVADYARWDLADRGLDAVVRASVHYYNTDDELDRLCDALPHPTAQH